MVLFIKANASLDSLVEKDILEDVETFRQELTANEDKAFPAVLKIEENGFQEVKELKPRKHFGEVIHVELVNPLTGIG
jgi:hypothetical protein